MLTPNTDLSNLTDNFHKKVDAFLSQVKANYGDIIRVTEAYRSPERQAELYAQGRTTPGSIVTNCDGYKNLSQHQHRNAIDICFTGTDPYPADQTKWNEINSIAGNCGIDWGGNWTKLMDKPHFQDDGTPWNNHIPNDVIDPIPEWAKESVEKAKKKDISKWDAKDCDQIVLNPTGEAILYKLGNITSNSGNGMNKIRFIVALDKMGLLD